MFYHKKTTQASFAYREKYGYLYNKLIELFTSLKLIKAMNFEEKHERLMNQTFETVKDSGIKVETLAIRSTFFNSLITGLGQLTVLIIGGLFNRKGEYDIRSVYLFFICFYRWLILPSKP